jgi:enoyl-CoA hydratase/carnithine racemase
MTDFERRAGSDFDGVSYRKEGAIATITLDRPEVGNSLTKEMHEAMSSIWDDVRGDTTIRVCVLTGSGEKHFCTGIDVQRVSETGTTTTGAGTLRDELHWTSRQNDVWKPTICAINGTVAGAGLHFVVDSDIVLATTDSSFLDAHVNVGMVGGVENVGLLSRVPLGTAMMMTLLGRSYRLSAADALVKGLVDELVDRDKLLERAYEIASVVAQNSPSAIARSMQAIWNAIDLWRGPATEYGWELVKAQWQHPDFREGPRAFAAGRTPNWAAADIRS